MERVIRVGCKRPFKSSPASASARRVDGWLGRRLWPEPNDRDAELCPEQLLLPEIVLGRRLVPAVLGQVAEVLPDLPR